MTRETSNEGGEAVSLFNLQELLLEELDSIRLQLGETRSLRSFEPSDLL
ncbi:hypothetical protein [Novosphingobium sp. AP12]|nr:hypothetical protein [Novosphingobium sp. AP12]